MNRKSAMKKERIFLDSNSFEDANGVLESVFELLHVSERFLRVYIESPKSLHPKQRESIERHIADICSGKCKKRIEDMTRELQRPDFKTLQMPERDR